MSFSTWADLKINTIRLQKEPCLAFDRIVMVIDIIWRPHSPTGARQRPPTRGATVHIRSPSLNPEPFLHQAL
jgi:hypothetical protein